MQQEYRRRPYQSRKDELIAGEGKIANYSGEVSPKSGAHLGARAPKIFFSFFYIGLFSFGGGVPAWMRRTFVERRGWLSEQEFSAALAVARIVPGANVVNLAVLVGNRLRGGRGAAAAVTGLLVGPIFVVIGLEVLYREFAGSPLLPAMLPGVTAAAVGLLIGMAVSSGTRLASARVKSGARVPTIASAIVFLMMTFILVGALRFPMVPTVLCVAPLSIAVTFLGTRHSLEGREGRDDRE
jgi:chromate transporter